MEFCRLGKIPPSTYFQWRVKGASSHAHHRQSFYRAERVIYKLCRWRKVDIESVLDEAEKLCLEHEKEKNLA